jgi:hypothetical protein
MLKQTMSQMMKKVLTQGVFAAALIGMVGVQGAGLAAQEQRLFSIVIHFEYQDGFESDYVLETGVSAAELGSALAESGQSHATGSVVRYHCFAVPE